MKICVLIILIFSYSLFANTPEVLVRGSVSVKSVEIVGENVFLDFNKSNVVQVFNLNEEITKSLIYTHVEPSHISTAPTHAATNNYFISMNYDTLRKFENNTGRLIEAISLDSLYGESNYDLFHHGEEYIIITSKEALRIVETNNYNIINESDSFGASYVQSQNDRNTFYNGKRIIHINENTEIEYYDLEIDERVHYFVLLNNRFIYTQVINNSFYVFSYNLESKKEKRIEFGTVADIMIIDNKLALLSGRSVALLTQELNEIKTIVVDKDFTYSSFTKIDYNNIVLVNRHTHSAYKLNITTEEADYLTEPINLINDFAISDDEKFLFISFSDFQGIEKYRIYNYPSMGILSEDTLDIKRYSVINFVESTGFVVLNNDEELYSINPYKNFEKKLFLSTEKGIDVFRIENDEILISKNNEFSIYYLYSKKIVDTYTIKENITEIFSNKAFYVLGSKESINNYYLTTIGKVSSKVKTIGIKHSLGWDEGIGRKSVLTENSLYALEKRFDGEDRLFIYRVGDIYEQATRFEFEDFRTIVALNNKTLICAKREPFRLERYSFDLNNDFNYEIEETIFIDPIHIGSTSGNSGMGTIDKMIVKGDNLIYSTGALSSLRRVDINKLKTDVRAENELNINELKGLIDDGANIKVYDYVGNMIDLENELDFKSLYSKLLKNRLYFIIVLDKGENKFYKFLK